VIVAGLAGLFMAFGVAGLVVAASNRRMDLAVTLAGPERESVHASQGSSAVGLHHRLRPDRALGSGLAAVIRRNGMARRFEADLFVTDRSLDAIGSESVLAAGVGLTLPVAVWALCVLVGIHISVTVPVALAVALGIGGVVLPFVALSGEARRTRMADRRFVGSYLDLVVLCMASGMGLEGALEAASGIADRAIARRLSRALAIARGAGRPPWAAFDELGRRSGLDELIELAAALSLAGQEGARIRATLGAKAASMRKRELATAEAAANRMTERLFLPGVLLLLGFLVFIGYPALSRIVTGL